MEVSIFKKSGKNKKRHKRPEICLSLACESMDEIRGEIEKYADYCSIIEWCVDAFGGAAELTQEDFTELALEVKNMSRGKKLIIDHKGSLEEANRLLQWSIGIADMIDVDADNPLVSKLVRRARRKGTKTIISHHDFASMPTRDEIALQFIKMEKTGADILKLAAMANSEQDTYALLEGAASYCQLKYHQPIVAIAMGEEGQVSRICAGDFGAVISYACGSKPTAPGQIDARRLYEYMNKYYSKEGL